MGRTRGYRIIETAKGKEMFRIKQLLLSSGRSMLQMLYYIAAMSLLICGSFPRMRIGA